MKNSPLFVNNSCNFSSFSPCFYIRSLATLFCSLFLSVVYAQNVPTLFEKYHASHHIEKVYISHDKPAYMAGDTIWGKVFLLNGRTHQAFDAEPIVYVNWINPDKEIVDTYHVKVKEGSAALSIPTNFDDKSGQYTLRAYTQYQRNFDQHFIFQKEISLIDAVITEIPKEETPTDFSVNFFPEGGYLVQGLENVVAFKAQNDLGENIVVSGFLVDHTGNKIVDLNSIHEGIGTFKFLVDDGGYKAIVRYKDIEKTFPLPKAIAQGFTLHINSVREDQIIVEVQSNTSQLLNHVKLLGHLRGQTFLNYSYEDGQQQTLVLEKSKIPSGVLHFTLFDQENRPVAERLVFNHNKAEQINASIDLSKEVFNQREAINGRITLSSDEVVTADASISIYNREFINDEITDLNILNYLLLQSDLKKPIRNIHQYFEEDTNKTRTFLDLLLMTHAWRRFNWQEVLTGQYPTLTYPPEQSITIAGRIKKYKSPKPTSAYVKMTILDEEAFAVLSVETENNGLFYFTGFDFLDTTNILLQANEYNKKKQKIGKPKKLGSRYVDIELFALEELDFEDSLSYPINNRKVNLGEAVTQKIQMIQQEKILQNDLWTINLEGVTVRAGINRAMQREQEIQQRYKERGLFYFSSSEKYLTSDPLYDGFKYNNIYDLILTVVPRAKIVIENGQQQIVYGSLSGGVPPVIVLDGVVMNPNRINQINPENIAVIDILKGLYAEALYDNSLAITMVSKDSGEVDISTPGVLNFNHIGYHNARTFYQPNYSNAKAKQADFRTTLYWNPMLKMSSKNTAFSTYASDVVGEHWVVVEGITAAGVPFFGKKSIWIK